MSDLPAVPALVMTAHPRQTEMLMECLRHWGMQACFAPDAAAAQASVRAMEASPPGQHPLALLDAALPDVETLARSLLAVRSDLRLLLLTRGGDMHDADDLVFHALLPLPIRHGRLGEALRFIQERRQYRLPVLHERRTEVSTMEEDTGKLILLAEDNPTNRTLAMHQLARIGFEADVVENGEQALAALAQHDYALVLMDCQMPVMDGFEATRRIRERERETGRHVSIIAMTANAMEGDRERCLEAGMDDYLSKPVRSETLAGMLRRHLPAQQENAAQVLDEAHLSELFGEDRDMRRSLLQGFYDGASPLQRKLDAALAAENFEDIGRIAHQLVGSAANLGARELEALAQSLRLAVRERDAQAARRLHAELEKAWRRFADYLSRDVS
jgi:CheY-like chemotaxis protein